MSDLIAVSVPEAARLLSMSRASFDRHVRYGVRTVRRGRMVLIPVAELEKWLDRNAARAA
jgi:predicted DNA-binding transcriptional regulator AlpA